MERKKTEMSMKKQYNSKQRKIKLMKIRKSMLDALMISVGTKKERNVYTFIQTQHIQRGRESERKRERERLKFWSNGR